MKRALLLHNPRCSKSRKALALLEDAQVEVEVRRYMDEPLSHEELRQLGVRLGGSVLSWVRTGEEEFEGAGLSADASESELLDALVAHPRLMQRPILVIGERALVARPPELVKELL